MEAVNEVLGEHLTCKGQFKVRLASCGNPDRGQTPGRSLPGVRKDRQCRDDYQSQCCVSGIYF